MFERIMASIHATALKNGWWDKPRTAPEIHMLIVTEIAEATEEARKGNEPVYHFKPLLTSSNEIEGHSNMVLEMVSGYSKDGYFKPEGELIELADAVIRIFDYCAFKQWDLEAAILLKSEYNKKRPHRHGNKVF